MTSLIFANMFIPYFIGQTKVAFLLLVPVIIIEALLLISILKTTWVETFKICAIANIASTIAGAIFIILEVTAIFIPFVAILFIFPGTLGLSIWIEYKVYKKNWKEFVRRRLLTAVVIVNVITYIPLLVLAFKIHAENYRERMERPRRISCGSNLKQIWLALQFYAQENNNFLPDKGLEQLRSNDYLTDYGVYHCPSSDAPEGKDNQKLNSKIVSYIYQTGLKLNEKDAKTPVAWDKPTNHKDYGNILFLDGHVQGVKGKNWMEQAGIKKKPNSLREK